MVPELDAPREIKTAEQIRKALEEVSPLALTQRLIDYEIADMQASTEILEQVYKEFEGGDNFLAKFAEPVTMAVIDAGIRCLGAKTETKNSQKTQSKKNPGKTSGGIGEDCQKKLGLSAQKIWREIKSFQYPSDEMGGYDFKPSAAHYHLKDQPYIRSVMDDEGARENYKKNAFDFGTRRCEYDGKTKLNFPDKYYSDKEKTSRSEEGQKTFGCDRSHCPFGTVSRLD